MALNNMAHRNGLWLRYFSKPHITEVIKHLILGELNARGEGDAHIIGFLLV